MGGTGGPLSADHPHFAERATELAHVAAWHAFVRLFEVAKAAGIPVLPVKGIVTAGLLYETPALRPIADVDVRVLPKHVGEIAKLARAERWTIVERSRSYGNVVLEISGISLDVESSVGPPGLCGLTVAEMLERAQEAERFGRRVPVPDLHDHALLLAVNVFKDKLVRAASWAVEDLHRIVSVSGFRATDLAALARRCAARTILWIVADWLVRARGDAGWEPVRAACGPLERRRYVWLYRSLVDGAVRVPAVLPLVTRLGSDRPVSRVHAVARSVAWQLAHPRRWS
jgi:hypothetical protein